MDVCQKRFQKVKKQGRRFNQASCGTELYKQPLHEDIRKLNRDHLETVMKVTVIGGGMGGLALAQRLRASKFQVSVFERDLGSKLRSQGYQIGLNSEGIAALNSINLPDNELEDLIVQNPISGINSSMTLLVSTDINLSCVVGFLMADQHLNSLVRFPVDGACSLVNRWRLRDILANGLDIHWNKRFLRYEESADGVTAYFEDGSSVQSDLLIGADGVNSKVREQYRSDLQFQTTGLTSVAGFFPMPVEDSKLPLIRKCVQNNLGRSLMNNTCTMLFMKFISYSGDPQVLWSLSFNTELNNTLHGKFDTSTSQGIRNGLIQRMSSASNTPPTCSQELLDLVEFTPEENILLPKETMTMIPTKNAHIRPTTLSPTYNRVVLLGDAAHAMTTHAGRGANTAFEDAVHLATTIEDPHTGLDTNEWSAGHASYEKKMFNRGYDAVKVSLENTRRIHQADNTKGIRFLSGMGYAMKTWNWLTKGTFVL